MFRTGKYKKKTGAGWNMQQQQAARVSPELVQKIEAKIEAKREEAQVKEDRKKLFRAWQRF